MRRLAPVIVAALSVVLASLISVAVPADQTSMTIDVPLDGTYDLQDGLSAHVTDVAIARVQSDDPAAEDALRYLVVSVELTRTKYSAPTFQAMVRNGDRTFEADSHNIFPSVGFITPSVSYFLIEIADIPGARLELTADYTLFTGGFHWIHSMDLGLTGERVAELDARAEVVEKPPAVTTEAIR